MAVLARHYDEITRRGVVVAGISVDSPEANAAMVTKLALPFALLSDPDRDDAIRPYDLADPKREISRTALTLIAPNGHEAFRYVGVDFADRPDDDTLFAALDALGLPPVDDSGKDLEVLDAQPSARSISLPDLAVYLRGARFAADALGSRATDEAGKAESRRFIAMTEQFISAVAVTRRLHDTD